jgi:MscS family membrane protein
MLEYVIFGNTIQNYILAISIVALFVAIGQIFSATFVKILKKLASKTETILDDVLIEVLEKPSIFALFIVGLYIMSSFIIFSDRGHQIYNNVLMILIVTNITWALLKLLEVLMDHYLMPMSQKTKSKLDDQVLPFLKKTLRVIVILIALIFVIKNMGFDVTSLIAGLGIGGLAFALAAQPLLTNLFGGIMIMADKPFQIGDRVRINQIYEGYVQEMGMRSTTIKTATGTMLQVPNSIVATNVIENLSATDTHAIRVLFDLGLEYSTSAEKVEEAISIIKDVFETEEAVLNDVGYYVTFNEFRDSSLNISCGYSINTPELAGAVKTRLNLAIKRRFEKAGINFAYPTQTVYVKNN